MIRSLSMLTLAAAMAAPASADGIGSLRPALSFKTASASAEGLTPLAIGKIGSGVQLAYRLDGTPAVGAPLNIAVQLSSRADAEVTLAADAGLGLQAPQQVLRVAAGGRIEQVLTVVPQSEGRFYLNLLVSSDGRGGTTGLAVQVGKGTPVLKPPGKVVVTPAGERIVSVPAR